MKKTRKILVYDPIDFAGGSKTATMTILKQVESYLARVIVLTSDSDTWKKAGYQTIGIREPRWLRKAETGLPFYLRQLFLLCNVLVVSFRHRALLTIGTSGPAVDFALFLHRSLTGKKYFQFVQGPVSASRSSALALAKADVIGVLETEEKTLRRALKTLYSEDAADQILRGKTLILTNGLDDERWPTGSSCTGATVLWAASLLKWKQLPLFVAAFYHARDILGPGKQLHGNVCYIRPRSIKMDVDEVPAGTDTLAVYEFPENFDDIRARSSIFISTSQNEPFGLSILEAMAAGLCVIIPKDGAYWDKKLVDGESVLKYPSGDSAALAEVLGKVAVDIDLRNKIAQNGRELACKYKASVVCLPMAKKVEEVFEM